MEINLLNDLLIIFCLSVAVIWICHRVRIPSLVGFLFTGLLVGPYGLGLVHEVHEVEVLAEIGVILLLFTIGIEFSVEKLMRLKRAVLLGGALQVVLTGGLVFVLARLLGVPFSNALFRGFLIALSSTAIVLKLFQEKGAMDTPHGQTALGVLIFQDMAVVPMMLVLPLLAGQRVSLDASFVWFVAKGLGLLALMILGAKYIVPYLLYQIARTRIRELFLLSVFVICFGVVWMTASLGLSLALGAFFAGIIVSESEYSHQALGSILPFRDIFTSLFFVSVGMLLDLRFFLQMPMTILGLTLLALSLKTLLAGAATLVLGYPLRTAILAGFGLGQIGEFSFILAKKGMEFGFLGGDSYPIFLAVSVLTMMATPLMMGISSKIADRLVAFSLPRWLAEGISPLPAGEAGHQSDHLIIIGFGLIGQHLVRAAKGSGIPYLIIESNPQTVRKQAQKGAPIFFGDASQPMVLEHANLKEARILVIAINDPAATQAIVETARLLSLRVHILVRTPYVQEMQPLLDLGADEVIPADFETSVEIFTRVLHRYLVSKDAIEAMVAEVRASGYEMFRSLSQPAFSSVFATLSSLSLETLRVQPGSPLAGQRLGEAGLRKKHGVTVLAIRRDSEILSNPDGESPIQANDALILWGEPEKVAAITSLFRPERKTP